VTRLVIDASVAIKWLVEEPGTDDALTLRRHELVAPDLLIIECANILWKKCRRKELTSNEAFVAAELLARAQIELAPMRPLLEPATRLAVALDHPAYDCAYLALAETLQCAMVTADASMCRKLRGHKALTIEVLDLADTPRVLT
jgi:predicted nucleic acid-binding protein